MVRLENDQVTVHCVISECGNGERLAIAKVAAEVLNVPMEAVTVVQADNGTNPADFGLRVPEEPSLAARQLEERLQRPERSCLRKRLP